MGGIKIKKLTILLLLITLLLTGCDGLFDLPLEEHGEVQVRVQEWSVEYLGEGNAFFEIEDQLDGYLQIAHVIAHGDIEVITYNSEKNKIDTIATRMGLVGLNFDSDPKYMQVISEGKWDIAQVPLGAADDRITGIGDTFNFRGNNIILVGTEVTTRKKIYIKTEGKVEVNVWGPERKVVDSSHWYEGTFIIQPYPEDMAIEIITKNDVYIEVR